MGTAEERLDYVEHHASIDLRYIMKDAEIDEKRQYDLVDRGFETLRRFIAIEDSSAGGRQAWKRAWTWTELRSLRTM